MIYYYTTTPFDVSILYTTTTLQQGCNGVVVYQIETSNVVMV
jgi:hypothetical protein